MPYSKDHYEANKERILSANKAYRDANIEKEHARSKRYRDANPDKVKARRDANKEYHKKYVASHYLANMEKAKERSKEHHLQKKYGISIEDKQSMLIAQRGQCQICQVEFGNYPDKTSCVIDHDHATGAVRALLCSRCNILLGHYETLGGAEWIIKADSYLQLHSEESEPILVGY